MVNRPRLFGSVLRTAAAVTLAAGALTACGQVNAGTAATVGDDRITTAQLDKTVAAWRREFQRDPQAALVQQYAQQQAQQSGGQARTVPFDLDSPRRSALYQMIDNRVWEQVARDSGLTVSRGEIDAFAAANGGRQAVVSTVLAHDLPADNADDMLRSALIERKALKQAGYDVETAQAQPDAATQAKAREAVGRLQALYLKAAQALRIRVNPRFGAYDPANVTITPVSFTLSKNEPGTGNTGTGETGIGTGESGTGAGETGANDPGIEGTG